MREGLRKFSGEPVVGEQASIMEEKVVQTGKIREEKKEFLDQEDLNTMNQGFQIQENKQRDINEVEMKLKICKLEMEQFKLLLALKQYELEKINSESILIKKDFDVIKTNRIRVAERLRQKYQLNPGWGYDPDSGKITEQ